LTEEDREALRRAVLALEGPSDIARLSSLAGRALELLGRALPQAASALVSKATEAALTRASFGHLLAMLLVLLPFTLLVTLVEWQRQIQIGASLLVTGFGVVRLVSRRHPRVLARIRPTQLGFWSFAVAIAHGAGLMLLPRAKAAIRKTGGRRRRRAGSTSLARPSVALAANATRCGKSSSILLRYKPPLSQTSDDGAAQATGFEEEP
jgi:hypothetical protein